MLPLDAYVIQEPPILPLDGSVLKQLVLPGQVFSIEADAASGLICSKAACGVTEDGLQQPVVHLDCKSTVLHRDVSAYKSFGVHFKCLSTT